MIPEHILSNFHWKLIDQIFLPLTPEIHTGESNQYGNAFYLIFPMRENGNLIIKIKNLIIKYVIFDQYTTLEY